MAKSISDRFHIMDFHSRRSPVLGTRGMVASSQPLASEVSSLILPAKHLTIYSILSAPQHILPLHQQSTLFAHHLMVF